ncbi:MAG: metal-dependent hydrolase, partial [Bacteroidales bacterium]
DVRPPHADSDPSDETSAAVGRRSFLARVADSITPLAVACAVLAVSPDFDNFFHTHRTWSHSLGAAAIVWIIVACVAWRARLPIVGTAGICAAAYGSHVLLDWLGRDDGPNGGLMVLWPLTTDFYKSGANLFLELDVHPRANLVSLLVRNVPAFTRELAILLPPFVLAWMLRARRAFPARTRRYPDRRATAERAASE